MENIDPLTSEYCAPNINRTKTIPSLELIIAQVCSYYKISHELMIHSKSGTHNWPKLAYMYICRKELGYTLKEISTSVGFLRHESVSTAVQEAHSRLQKSPDLMGASATTHLVFASITVMAWKGARHPCLYIKNHSLI